MKNGGEFLLFSPLYISELLAYAINSFFSGHPEEAIADVVQFPVCPGDRILLCSDGVHKSMESEDLEARMMEAKSLEEILHGFDLSCWKYGDDNYTAILIEVE